MAAGQLRAQCPGDRGAHPPRRDEGATVSQLALAWLLAQGDDIVPIPGTRSAARVAENVAAASLVLTASDPAQITRILPNGGFGARFPDGRVPVRE
jgi:aryl-alcohol dehydrogenase-like predicted oxidoreductase